MMILTIFLNISYIFPLLLLLLDLFLFLLPLLPLHLPPFPTLHRLKFTKPVGTGKHLRLQNLGLLFQNVEVCKIIIHAPACLHDLFNRFAILSNKLMLLDAKLLQNGREVGILIGKLSDVVAELDLQRLLLVDECLNGVVEVYAYCF
jgi:hypothetical protein